MIYFHRSRPAHQPLHASEPLGQTSTPVIRLEATGVDTKICYLGAVQHGSSGHNGQGGQSQQVLALGANSDTSRTIVRKIIQSLLAFGECAATGRRQTGNRYAGRFA
jgi:hypothetical protein